MPLNDVVLERLEGWKTAAMGFLPLLLGEKLEPNPAGGVPLQRLQNADAEIYGAEVELEARPVRGLDLNLGAAYVHATYTDFIDPIRGNFKGNRLDKTPSLQMTGGAGYSMNLSPDWSARVGADFSYQSKVYFSAINASPMTSAVMAK